ncbi:MAG: prepilin-type N-terminal cleavage/methylation domain-containing protein [Candidatus Andersenbacteria bacterium]
MNKYPQKGFTLIELLIAAGIFVIVMMIIVGLFSRFMMMQRRSIAENRVLEEVRFALELFSRETRTAYGDTYNPEEEDVLLYRNQNGLCVVYRLSEQVLQRAELDIGTSNCTIEQFAEVQFTNLTSKHVQITELLFDAEPSTTEGTSLAQQGFVTLFITAQSAQHTLSPLTVRSSVTSRQVNPYVQQ